MTTAAEQPSAVVPEASPDSNEKQNDKKAPVSRRTLYLFAGIALVIAAVLCIALPLALRDKDSNSSSSSSSDAILVVDTEQSQTGPNGSTPVTPVTNAGATDETSRVGDNTESEGEGVTATGGGAYASDNSNQGEGVNVSGGGAYVMETLRSLPLFGSNLINGYDDQSQLDNALKLAFRQQAQKIIEQNIEWNSHKGHGYGGYDDVDEAVEAFAPMPGPEADVANFAAADMADSAAGGGAADEGVTDFGTNNQEENVDEADMIKADANYIYAAYGDYILIWDTAGDQVAQVQMPPIELPDEWGEPETEIEKKSSFIDPEPRHRPKPNIRSMLLTEQYLVAVVDGYNNDYSWWWGRPTGDSPPPKMLYGHRASRIQLYRKTETGNLTFVGSKDINGNFVDARSIGDTVHLATSSSVDTWTHIGQPLDWWHISNGTKITADEYRSKATQIADTIVPRAAKKLIEELRADDGELPTLLQVNQWFTQVNDTREGGAGFELPYQQSYDVISNVAQVTSFDVNEALASDGSLTTSSSAYMAPSYFDTMYGTDEHLVLATAGWDWNPFRAEGEQTTYLVALEIQGASTNFVSVGTLKGHLLNQYALDIVNGELRAATTVERFSWWWGRPMPMPMPMPFMTEEAVDMMEVAERGGGRRSLQELCGPPPDEDECVSPEAYEECLILVEKGCSYVEISDDCPATYDCTIVGEESKGLCPPLDNLERDDCLNSEGLQNCINLSNLGCPSVDVRESCPVQFSCNMKELAAMDPDELCPKKEDDSCVNDNNYIECVNLVSRGCSNIAIMESCPLQFSCADPADNEPIVEPPPPPFEDENDESRTENYMVVLKLVGDDVPGKMSEKGRVQIGEKNERITSVRFFDNVAYAVTFERTDPFYVLDMSVPEVLGELKLPGFSSYLHSMNAENSLLLAIGQNATDEGRETGLMVTVFDARDPSDPKALVSHTFENDDNAYSGSSVQWDYKAFRYVAGKLVVPLEIWYRQEWDPVSQLWLPLPEGAENFRGFAVLDVDTTAITEQFRVSHMNGEGCYCSYLPQRSFVYDGDLMTIQENVVVSTSLSGGVENWRFPIEVKGAAEDCCW